MENDGGTLPNIIIFVVKSGGFPQWLPPRNGGLPSGKRLHNELERSTHV